MLLVFGATLWLLSLSCFQKYLVCPTRRHPEQKHRSSQLSHIHTYLLISAIIGGPWFKACDYYQRTTTVQLELLTGGGGAVANMRCFWIRWAYYYTYLLIPTGLVDARMPRGNSDGNDGGVSDRISDVRCNCNTSRGVVLAEWLILAGMSCLEHLSARTVWAFCFSCSVLA